MSTQADTTENNPTEVRDVSTSKLAESVQKMMTEEDVSVVVIYKDSNEKHKISGEQLLESVESMVSSKKVSRLIITKANGETFLDVSLSAGLVMTVFATFLVPKLIGLGVIGGLLARMKVEIVSPKVKTVEIKGNQVE